MAACCPLPFSSKHCTPLCNSPSSDCRFVRISHSRPKTFVAGSFDSRFGVPSLSQLVAGSFDSRTRVVGAGCQGISFIACLDCLSLCYVRSFRQRHLLHVLHWWIDCCGTWERYWLLGGRLTTRRPLVEPFPTSAAIFLFPGLLSLVWTLARYLAHCAVDYSSVRSSSSIGCLRW